MKLVGHVPAVKLLESFSFVERVLSLGIGVEIQLSSQLLDLFTLKDFGNLKNVLGSSLRTLHAPFLDLNPGATDSYALEVVRKRFLETTIVANVLEAEVVVFHTGYHPNKVDPIFERWFETALDTFQLISEESDFKIALENVFDRDERVLKNFLDSLPDKFGICLDVGHLNLFSVVSYKRWLETFRSRIFEFHLHDNLQDRDAHLPIGRGSFPFKDFVKSLKSFPNNFIFNLENKTLEDLKESLKVWEELWSEI